MLCASELPSVVSFAFKTNKNKLYTPKTGFAHSSVSIPGTKLHSMAPMSMMMVMVQGSFLSELATSLVPSQIVQPGKPPLTAQVMMFAQHVLVLRLM